MRVWLGLRAVRILLTRNSSLLIPVRNICRSTTRFVRHDVVGGNCRLLSTKVSCSFHHRSKCYSSHESAQNREFDNAHATDSPESIMHGNDDADALHKRDVVSIIEGIYSELMTMPKWLTADEWSAVGDRFDAKSFLSAVWPSILLHVIASKTDAVPGLYDVGMSLVEYVASQTVQHRLLRLVSAIAVLIHQGGENHHEEALALYDELCVEYDVFDHTSARVLITALAKTRYWQRCLDLIDQVKIASSPYSGDYSPVIVAAMENGNNDLAYELLTTLSRNGLMADDKVFFHILANGTVEEVLMILKDFQWIPTKCVIDSVIAHIQRYIQTTFPLCCICI